MFINDIAIYSTQDCASSVSVRYISQQSIEESLLELGIEMAPVAFNEQLLSGLQRAIRNNNPVMLWVDSYYQEMRRDTYGKMHWPHALVVHGFDNVSRQCHIIEHKHRETLSYTNTTITFDCLERSYNGFRETFMGQEGIEQVHIFSDQPSYVEFNMQDAERIPVLEDQYARYLQFVEAHQEEILEGIAVLEEFASGLPEKFRSGEADPALAKEWIEQFNHIVSGKQAEMLKVQQFNNPALCEIVSSIILHWVAVRKIAARYAFAKTLSDESVIEIQTGIEKICLEERQYLNTLLSGCQD
nr:BtrH N-terminal domain-containing protein [Paenibacillus oenotherae]